VGEGGTGRSALARRIHLWSERPEGPLVEFDPATVPASLFESELFGSEAGAFSGASRPRRGRVGEAEGGTFVLDRVEEIPLASQAKLLRLLSEAAYAPLGGSERRVDLRLIAIAADDLLLRVDSGRLRADLFHRLDVLSFRVPALRERRAELPQILAALLADLGERSGRGDLRVDEDCLAWMEAYSWPGNLRELRNSLERAMLDGEALSSGCLRPTAPKGLVFGARTGDGGGAGGGSAPPNLSQVEAEAIRAALRHTRGHQGRAAEILGISRKSLWERRRRLGIP
jgi:two-component system response regulator HydG